MDFVLKIVSLTCNIVLQGKPTTVSIQIPNMLKKKATRSRCVISIQEMKSLKVIGVLASPIIMIDSCGNIWVETAETIQRIGNRR